MVDTKVNDETLKSILEAGDEFYVNAVGNLDRKGRVDGIRVTNSQVTDFDNGVTNNAAVLLNTAKTSNVTHTGDITGSTTLTIGALKVTSAMLAGSIALSKLTDAPEANATADQTGAEIKTSYQAEIFAYTDTKNTKLGGIEALADVTDTTNVNLAAATVVGTVTVGTWSADTIAINKGGTGNTTAQASIDALSAVSGATNEHVLTKDTGTGNAIWKVAASGFTDPMTTRGDIIFKNAAGTTTRLAAGANTFVLTSDGTDISWAAGGGGDALVANPLSQFAATTSLQLKGVISDETGSGALVFATSPTLVTPILGTPTSGDLQNCTAIPSGQLTGSIADARLSSNVPLKNAANTFTTRQNFTSTTTGAIRLIPFNGDPVFPTDGEVWYHSSEDRYKGRQNGVTVPFVTPASTDTLTNKSIVSTQLTGIIPDARMPNLTGDITTSEGAVATTIASGAVDIAHHSATGTPDATTFYRGDNTWATPAGSGDMVLASAQTNSGVKTFLDTTMKLRNVANTFDGYFVNTNTANRIYTLPDEAGTVSLIGRTETLVGKTLTSPTIGSFTNSTHTHLNAAGGGTITAAAISDYATATATFTNKTIDESATGNTIKIRRGIQTVLFDFTTDITTGNGKFYFHIDPSLAGNNLIDVHAEVITAGTTGTTDIQIANVTQAVDMLSTKLTIDTAETGSDTAATPAVIDTANDDVAENDLIRIDVDAISTTAPKGLIITLGFRVP